MQWPKCIVKVQYIKFTYSEYIMNTDWKAFFSFRLFQSSAALSKTAACLMKENWELFS